MKTIVTAVQYPDHIMLEVTDDEAPAGSPSTYPYALYADDPYGDAPFFRAELQRMVEADEIVITEGVVE